MHHMPLKYALTEYQDDRDKLLALLSCLNRAAEVSDLIAELVESGEMFHVLRFTGKEAYISFCVMWKKSNRPGFSVGFRTGGESVQWSVR